MEAWFKRNDHDNIILSEGLGVTSLDIFPVYSQRPKRDKRLFYKGKHGKHVIKVQVIADNW